MLKVNQYIDHTLLKATATEDQVSKLCQEAIEHQFNAVCVNSSYVSFAAKQLRGSSVQVCAVVGFPLGASATDAKIHEAEIAVSNGATEIDMVVNLGKLKSGDHSYVETEIRQIKSAIGNRMLKVILETCYLDPEEIQLLCKLAIKAEADFVKTSTGFGSRGASEQDIALMRDAVKNQGAIKASGGIRDLETVLKYIELGVRRIGTSSGVSIMRQLEEQDNQG